MTAIPSYAVGTVSIDAGATIIEGAGGPLWASTTNARPGDDIIVAGHIVIIEDVIDNAHIAIDAWPFAAVPAGTPYKIVQRSPLRFAGAQASADVIKLVAALNTEGLPLLVPPGVAAPDPSLGEENQFAIQPSTFELWLKVGGAWVFQGIYKGFRLQGEWSAATNYNAGDVVSRNGSSYVADVLNINAPPESSAATWQLLASKGEPGASGRDGVDGAPGQPGQTGASYTATSITSVTIGLGPQTFATQAGLAYLPGARVRIASAADVANYMEGSVTAYSGPSLTVSVSKVVGGGTHADWNINLAGDPGAAGTSILPFTPQGRLTLTSGTAVTTSDVTGSATIYYTNFNGNRIALYDGTNWVPISFSELAVSLSGLAANTNYDAWGRISAGALAIDFAAWTNDVTRAAAIAQQDGIDVKSGDPSRRLLGTIQIINIAGQTEDSEKKRYVSNRYNETLRTMKVVEATPSWNYSLATLRQANGNAANQLDFVTCVPRAVAAEIIFAISNTTKFGTGYGGLGIDSTTADSSTTRSQAITPIADGGVYAAKINYAGYIAAGRHFLAWLEGSSPNGGAMAFYGNAGGTALQCGIAGAILS